MNEAFRQNQCTNRLISTLLRFFFYLLYGSLAWTYDWVAGFVSQGLWQEWVLEVAADCHGPKVLELGHGPGHLQKALYEKGIWIVVATFPTEYIVDACTLKEVRRVLKLGGELVVMPVAWITGKRFLERAAAYLFHVTGQAPEWDDRALDPAREAGFKVEVEKRKLQSSELLIIHAWKI
ncbi:MAG: hypothetical protein P8Y03_11865 [Anaerolineales bacterium]